MRTLRTLVLILSICFSVLAQAQFKQSGYVYSADGEALVGVFIRTTNNDNHTHSNQSGYFEIKLENATDSLEFSYIGYDGLLIAANQIDEIVYLKSAPLNIDELEVKHFRDPLNLSGSIELLSSGVRNSQELLTSVPGLFIGQHAGGGKAEQMFLRGFDLDHGTDLSLDVDGIPVNMVSHAHGQGYSDLHFVIPELIRNIEFEKGAYNSEFGNFATSGRVSLKTKDKLKHNTLTLSRGMFNSSRALLMYDPLEKVADQNLLIAFEHLRTDGPFDNPQQLTRDNAVLKYTKQSKGLKLSGMASYFYSEWLGSGQIPLREVEAGRLSRFGAIDPTEGGNTSRANANFNLELQLMDKLFLEQQLYYSYYTFELFSNFSFFDIDSVYGDQIRQVENRQLYGSKTSLSQYLNFGGLKVQNRIGFQLRSDFSKDNALSKTRSRTVLQYHVQKGDIRETNTSAFAQTEAEVGRWRFNLGLRYDLISSGYRDELNHMDLMSKKATQLSPKFSVQYQWSNFRFYAKTGRGFHSNDSRLVVLSDQLQLSPSFGSDLGVVLIKGPIYANVAIWDLSIEDELVYVGDEGIVESVGKTYRKGIDFGLRAQLVKRIYTQLDLSYTHARQLSEEGSDLYIPLAPSQTLRASLVYDYKSYMFMFTVRSLSDRPADEFNSIKAKGYTVLDANLQKSMGHFNLQLLVQNLLNVDWMETQFLSSSRLSTEPESVEDIHFTPGTPFNFRLQVQYRF